MKQYNFDLDVNRKNTNSVKWDFFKENDRDEDTLAIWVADMDLIGCVEVEEAIKNASKNAILGYTGLKNEYYDVVFKWYKEKFEFIFDKDSFLLSPGVLNSLNVAIKVFTKEKDSILYLTPSYPPFRRGIVENDRNPINSDLVLKNGVYEMDFDDIENKIIENKVKMMIFCSPHNPTGRVWTKKEIDRLGKLCLKHNVIVFSDEIHSDFTYEGHKHYMFTTVNEDFKKNSLIAFAPSKTFNIAGLQCSYIVIENEEMRQKFSKEMNSFGFHTINLLGQVASFACYKHGDKWLLELKEYLSENLRYFEKEISKIKGIKIIKPQGTYLVWLDMSDLNLGSELYDKIKKISKLWVNEGISFGDNYANFIRINIACQRFKLEEAIKRLKMLVN